MTAVYLNEVFKPSDSVLRNRYRNLARARARTALREAHPVDYKRFRRFQVGKHPSSGQVTYATDKKLAAKYPQEFNELYVEKLREFGITL